MSNDLNNRIDANEREITSMAAKIEHAETELKNPNISGDDRAFWRNSWNKLQDEKYELQKQRTLLLSKSKSSLYLCADGCRCDHSNFLPLI
jgi:hypothetical protein